MSIFKTKTEKEVLAMMSGVEMSSQPTLEDPPSEPPPEPQSLAPNELYELLVDFKLRGFKLAVSGGDDPILTIKRPFLLPEEFADLEDKSVLSLSLEEIALLKEHKVAAIAWIVGIEDHRRLRLRIKAALEEWFAADEGARVWALTLPRRGEKYVAAQLWQVIGELTDRGVSVANEEREVAVVVLMEVVGEIGGETA